MKSSYEMVRRKEGPSLGINLPKTRRSSQKDLAIWAALVGYEVRSGAGSDKTLANVIEKNLHN